MKEQRKKSLWKIKFRLKFLELFFASIIILNLFIFYALWDIFKKMGGSLAGQRSLVVLLLGFSVAGIVFLITILVLLHRALGPFPRMENILDRILQGDYSLRITLRKKDILYSFVNKLNKILDLLETKTKGGS